MPFTGSIDAEDVDYPNTKSISGNPTNVKTAIDGLKTEIDNISVGGLADIDHLPGDTVDDNLIDNALLDADLRIYAGITPSADVQTVLGCSTYADIRTALGLVIGTNVLAPDGDGSSLTGLTWSQIGSTPTTLSGYGITDGATATSLHLDDVLTALGIESEDVHFGTFTGSTIGDNLTAKAIFQALESAFEGLAVELGQVTEVTEYCDTGDLENLHNIMGESEAIGPGKWEAVGDGITDDTQAIQAAVDSIDGGVLFFRPGAIFKVSDTISIDTSKVKGIIGNNATIITDSDIDILHISGGLETGTAIPGNDDTEAEEGSMAFFIKGLKITSSPALSVGTGLKLTGTFGVNIESCHIYKVNIGVCITERNRNIIINGNHIWNCRSYGIHYDHANCHQSIINNNHISYAKTPLFFDNGDVHNIQIVGNDIEGGYCQDSNYDNAIKVLADEPDTQISQIQITGNSIEEHGHGNSLIYMYRKKFESNQLEEGEEQPIIRIFEIVGNELSGSKECNIELHGPTTGVISNNTLRAPHDGYSIKAFNLVEALTITGNVIAGINEGDRFGGALYIESDPDYPSALQVGTLIVSNNSIAQQFINPIVIRSHPDDTRTGALIYDVVISGNSIQMALNRGTRPEALVDLTGYSIDINLPYGTIGSLMMNNNILRCRNYSQHGIRVNAGTTQTLIVKDNIIRGLVARGGTNPIWYDLPTPGANVIIDDNIPSN